MLGLATALNSSSLKKKSVLTNKFSAELDGTGDYIDVSTLSSDIDKAAGTISMWVKVQATSGNESFFNCSDGTSGDNKLVLMYNTSSAVIQANYKAGGSNQDATHSIAGDDLTGLGWLHVAMTYNVSTPLIQLFLNGTRVAQRTTSITQMSEDVAIDRVRLGSNANADNTYHHGHIDEFIYIGGKDLTESEMLLLYNSGKPDDIGDLPLAIYNAIKCWLRFGDGRIDGTADQTSVIFDEKNSTLGINVITNGDFNGNADSWFLQNAEHQPGSNNVILTKPSSGNSVIYQTGLSFQEGQILRYKFKFVSFTGSPNIRIDGFSGSNPLNTSTTFAASGGDVDIYIRTDRAGSGVFLYITGGSVGDTVVIDDVSVQIVQGNPGFCVADATVGNNNVP